MKKCILLLLISLLAVTSLNAFANDMSAGLTSAATSSSNKANVVTKTFNSKVLTVESSTVCKIILKKSNTPCVIARAPQKIMDITVLKLNNNHLSVSFVNQTNNPYNSANDIEGLEIEIQQPDLKKIIINGVSNIIGGGNFSQSDITFNINGVVNMTLTDLQCNSLTVNDNGVGNVEISGAATYGVFNINGNGSIGAYNFKCENVNARVSGVGSIECYADKELIANVTGLGNIYYKGKPANVVSDSKSTKIHSMSESGNAKATKKKVRNDKRSKPSTPSPKKRKVIMI